MSDNKNEQPNDEILDILESYRKKNPPAETPLENKQTPPQRPVQNRPVRKVPRPEQIDSENLPDSKMNMHFTDTVQIPEPENAHLSNSVDHKKLKKQKKLQAGRLTDADPDQPKNKTIRVLMKNSFLFKAFFFILFVVVVSAYSAYFIITVGNDVFAFVKGNNEAVIVIEEDATIDEVAASLRENNLIEHEWVFKLYLKYRSKDETPAFIPGEHKVSASLNYSQMIHELTTKKRERIEVRVVIPEGYTVDQIIDLLVEKGIGTREGYVEAINEYPYKHEFVKELEALGYSADRKYRLEGYLFPDTYDFYTDTKEYLVINRFLNNFHNRFWREYKTEYKAILDNANLSFDQLITLASIVQAEAKFAEDFEYISYVFHNRLNSGTKFPKLESDATIQYLLDERIEDMTYENTEIEHAYNTYRIEGLPPGAICNPGLDAISGAIFPSTPLTSSGRAINAYYFVSNKAGKTYYGTTKAEHDRNKTQVKKDNQQIKDGTYDYNS